MEYEIEEEETVSMAILRAVSAVEGCDPLSLKPLADVVDTDALDALFASRYCGTSRSGGRLSFVYSNCRITVEDGERLTLRPLAPGSSETNDSGGSGGSVERPRD